MTEQNELNRNRCRKQCSEETFNRVGLPCQTWLIIFTWGELDYVLVQRQRKAISLGKQAQHILCIAEGTAALAASEARFLRAVVGLFADRTRSSVLS